MHTSLHHCVVGAVVAMAGAAHAAPAGDFATAPILPAGMLPEGAQFVPGTFNTSSIFGGDRPPLLPPGVDRLGQTAVKSLVARSQMAGPGPATNNGESPDCFAIDGGFPSNMHWNDPDQFVLVDDKKCRPALEMHNGTCSHHMDLGTRCAAFCQISAFYFFGPPIDLMGGKMCRHGEGCELKQEKSFRVEISNTEVNHHVFDATASINPSASWGLGFENVNIPLPTILAKRAAAPSVPHTGFELIDGILAEMRRQEAAMAAQEAERAATGAGRRANVSRPAVGPAAANGALAKRGWFGNAIKKIATTAFRGRTGAAAAGGGDAAAADAPTRTLSIPIPTISNPTATVAASFSAHWTRDWTRTYYHSVERASFTSLTHKQVPGEGCGAFWAAPIGVAYCGWLSVPRLPPAIQEDALQWLSSAPQDELYKGTFRLGSWSKDGSHAQGHPYPAQMWNVGPGQCPVNYHEVPYCTAAPLLVPAGHDAEGNPSAAASAEGQALHRTVWRPYDCKTGHLLPSHAQPREVREQVDFNEFFRDHVLKEPRLFNPHLAWTTAKPADTGGLGPAAMPSDSDDKWAEYDEAD